MKLKDDPMSWRDPNTDPPDEGETVFVECDGTEPVWLGYRDEGLWYCVDGLPACVTGWMPLPAPRGR